jgi:hypothetical protein
MTCKKCGKDVPGTMDGFCMACKPALVPEPPRIVKPRKKHMKNKRK